LFAIGRNNWVSRREERPALLYLGKEKGGNVGFFLGIGRGKKRKGKNSSHKGKWLGSTRTTLSILGGESTSFIRGEKFDSTTPKRGKKEWSQPAESKGGRVGTASSCVPGKGRKGNHLMAEGKSTIGNGKPFRISQISFSAERNSRKEA